MSKLPGSHTGKWTEGHVAGLPAFRRAWIASKDWNEDMSKEMRRQDQVLVNLGNRFVVFGEAAGPPQEPQFNPDEDSVDLPRVADEYEVAGERIAQSLRLSGHRRLSSEEAGVAEADLVLVGPDGQRTIIDLKVRDHDPRQRELLNAFEWLRSHKDEPGRPEVWLFNVERLGLSIITDGAQGPQVRRLTPLDVWEKSVHGLFRRSDVVAAVDDWVKRVDALYNQVETWLEQIEGVSFERTRTMTMFEELMQKYAVTARDIPILDVLQHGSVLASFVPRGLWMLGSQGRVDVIANAETRMLVAFREAGDFYVWHLVSAERRTQTTPLTSEALLQIVSAT